MRVAGVIDEWALLRGGVELEMRRQGVSAEASAATMSEYMTMLQQRVGERPIDIAVIGQTSDATQPDAVRRLAATGATVIALAVRLAPADLLDLCAAGAFAVVGRDAQGEELSAAVRAARSGGRYIAPGLLSTIFDDKAAPAHQQRYGLTERERQVLAEVVSGRSNAEISERLLIGSQTVKTHLSNIYDKLGVRRRTQAARLAVLHDLV